METQNNAVETNVEQAAVQPELEETVTSSEPEESDNKTLDSAELASLIEQQDKALAKAEKKIVALKREAKQEDNFDEETIEDKVNRIVEERLSQQTSQPERDKDLDEIQRLRKKNAEILETLRSKAALSNNSLGTTQARIRPEEDLTKKYTRDDLVVLQRRADQKKISLKEYLKLIQ